MRFEYHKILPSTSHVGFPFKKNLLLQGAITHHTYIGYIERVAFYYKIDWKPFFLGSYAVALVFLYGGHVHLINTKKEWTGVFKGFFEKFQKKEKNFLSKNGMEWIGHELLYSEKDLIDLKNLYHIHTKYKEKPILPKKKKTSPKKIDSQKTESKNPQPKTDSQKAKRIDFQKAASKNIPKKIDSQQAASETPSKGRKTRKKSLQWKGLARFFFKKKYKKSVFFKKSIKERQKKLLTQIRSSLKNRKRIQKPILTVHDSGFLPGSISNWTEHVRFSNQYFSIPEAYPLFLKPYKKLREDYIRLKNQSIGFFSLKKNKKSNPIPRKKPDIIMVLNSGKEYGILFESFRESRPVFATVNTFTKKEWIDFPLDGNDTNLYSMVVWCRWLTCIFQYVHVRRFHKKKFFLKPSLQTSEDFYDYSMQFKDILTSKFFENP